MSRKKNYRHCTASHVLIAALLLMDYTLAQVTDSTEATTVQNVTVLNSSTSPPNVTTPMQNVGSSVSPSNETHVSIPSNTSSVTNRPENINSTTNVSSSVSAGPLSTNTSTIAMTNASTTASTLTSTAPSVTNASSSSVTQLSTISSTTKNTVTDTKASLSSTTTKNTVMDTKASLSSTTSKNTVMDTKASLSSTTTPVGNTSQEANGNSTTQTTQTPKNGSSAEPNKDNNATQSSTSEGPTSTVAPPSNKFSIFFVNDMKYDIFPIHHTNGSLCENMGDDCIGGLSRIGGYIKTELASNPNHLWLNTGNFIGGDWFKILKYNTALEAIKFLQFNFVAVGPDIFRYGRDASEAFLEELGSKVLVSNIDVPTVKKSSNVVWGKCNVSVIGFVDDTDKQEHSAHGIDVENLMESLKKQLNETQSQQEKPSELITIAFGSTTRENAKKLANSTNGIDFILYSGNCSPAENSSEYFCWDTVNKTNSKTRHIGSLGIRYTNITHRFIVGEVQITLGDNCTIENVEHIYHDYSNATSDQGAPDLAKKLSALKSTLTENTKNLTGEGKNCSHSECVLGNLLTDAILTAVKDNDLWNENGSRIAVFPAMEFEVNKTLPQGKVTATDLYDLIKEDAYIYKVTLTGKELNEMMHISLNSHVSNNSYDFLHISGLLQVQYNTTADNKLQSMSLSTVPASSTSMKLEAIDLSNNKTTYTVAMPHYTLFKMASYQKLFSSINDSRISYHNVTVIEALTNYLEKKEFLTLPLVGYRQIKLVAPPSVPEEECPSHTGTTILVTLVITAIFLGSCYGVWWYVFRRNRSRSASTMAMINMD